MKRREVFLLVLAIAAPCFALKVATAPLHDVVRDAYLIAQATVLEISIKRKDTRFGRHIWQARIRLDDILKGQTTNSVLTVVWHSYPSESYAVKARGIWMMSKKAEGNSLRWVMVVATNRLNEIIEMIESSKKTNAVVGK